MKGAGPLLLAALLLVSFSSTSALAQWRPLGPWGGNARVLAADPFDPDHILLGSGGGALFESLDGGRRWQRLARLGAASELMLKNIVFDRRERGRIYVAGWNLSGSGGGFFLSNDGGRSWTEPEGLGGQSIQALAQAPSSPSILVAGTLDGLYRSLDRGLSWRRISPSGHPDLKNFESVAIDPADPRRIYAGTWHLPWKTVDGGEHWSSIKQGIIDDSDVFSIVIDHSRPQTVYASACSGIYKSEDAGALFRRVQGIPGSAIRTRVLRQDPEDARVVYAGTTGGLWKTIDGGESFRLISPANFILNDVLIDRRNPRRLLIATDRGGVFASDDAGESFQPSNEGFSQRQLTALVVVGDQLYAGVVNDKEFGGVFAWRDGGWRQLGEGLDAGDVLDLAADADGTLMAATQHGLYTLSAEAGRWQSSRALLRQEQLPSAPLVEPRAMASRSGKGAGEARATSSGAGRLRPGAWVIRRQEFAGRASALLPSGGRWYAATEAGLLMSDNRGISWSRLNLQGGREFYSITARASQLAAATTAEVWFSSDRGSSWQSRPLPAWVSRVYGLALNEAGELWAATREGALRWRATGAGSGQWEHVLDGLPAREVTSIRAQDEWMLAAVAGSDALYMSRDQGRSWQPQPSAGWELSGALASGDALYLITRQHGVLVRESPASLAASTASSAPEASTASIVPSPSAHSAPQPDPILGTFPDLKSK